MSLSMPPSTPILALSDKSLRKRFRSMDISNILVQTSHERAVALMAWLLKSKAWSSSDWCIDLFLATTGFLPDGRCNVPAYPDKESLYADSEGNCYPMNCGPYLTALKELGDIGAHTLDFIGDGAAAHGAINAEDAYFHLLTLLRSAQVLFLEHTDARRAAIIYRKICRWEEILGQLQPA